MLGEFVYVNRIALRMGTVQTIVILTIPVTDHRTKMQGLLLYWLILMCLLFVENGEERVGEQANQSPDREDLFWYHFSQEN